jgi:hypothetical protein
MLLWAYWTKTADVEIVPGRYEMQELQEAINLEQLHGADMLAAAASVVGQPQGSTLAMRTLPLEVVRAVAPILVTAMAAPKHVHRLHVVGPWKPSRFHNLLLVPVDIANPNGGALPRS